MTAVNCHRLHIITHYYGRAVILLYATYSCYFRIDDIHVAISVYQDIARNYIPNNVCTICVSALIVLFGKT